MPMVQAARVEKRNTPLPAITLAGAAGITAWFILSDALIRHLTGEGGLALNGALLGRAIFGIPLTALLYLLLRHQARKVGMASDILDKAFSLSSNAVCICRVKDGRILKTNHGFSALTGYRETEVLNRKVNELSLWQFPFQYQTLARRVQQGGELHDAEVSLVAKDGGAKAGLLTVSLVEYGYEPCLLAIIRDNSELMRARERIEKLSYYDPDTGLPNQNLLMDRLNQLISLNGRDDRPTVVIYVGLDGFTGIVDALGHTGSSEVVRHLARRLTDTLRHTDTIARLHRDELVIVLGGDLRETDIDLVIAKIEQVFDTPIEVPTGAITISASLGIACFLSDGLTAEMLLQHSHAAMNQARESSSSFQYYSAAMNVKAMERLRFESGMMRSLEAGEFFLCYQPKYAGNGRDMTGMEALVRWRLEAEIVMPDRFIPLAEENGMIVRLSEWVLREACRQNRSWQLEGLPPLQVSVNISARLLRDNDFAEKVEAILGETGLAPEFLELEITETAIMGISDHIVLKLLRLKELGVSISIDDFGTGYSSLSYLKNLPVDKIKIDRSFVMDIVSDPGDAAIVEAIISIAHALDLCVIAEGVESKGQLDFLMGRDCTEFQGYYFSKPLSAEHFGNLLRMSGTTTAARGRSRGGGEGKGKRAPSGQGKAQRKTQDCLAPPAPALCLVEGKVGPAIASELMIDVAHPIQPVSPQDRIVKVLSRFQLDSLLMVLPVVEGQTVVGIVNRATFLEEHIIGRHGFAAHINHAKQIRELMVPLAFSFEASTPVEEAARALQPMLGSLRIDNICITRDGAYAGMIDVNRFIKSMTEIQMVLAKGANPLTGLPGNTSIERMICQRLASGVPFDIAYFDIDDFKPYNDHYGFQKGDEVIKKLAEIIAATAASSPLAPATFCGHIGGDDFILISESLQAEGLSELIVARFERERPAFHGPRDLAAGGYRSLNRRGEQERFPLISLSVGIVNTSLSLAGSYAKLASLSTEVKKAAKKRIGSAIVVHPPAAQLPESSLQRASVRP